ncbi:MAG: NADH-quinone oxidoreductase subunit J [Chloroflexi bacterium]|nr:NADH-quinone oxidoreductase subunit J [Chloroflexota bacterium]
MTGAQILFIITGGVILFSAVMTIIAQKMIHSALWFVLALLGVAAIFAMLEASFFAVVQVLVYVGAIAILIIFAVMLTRRSLEDQGKQINRANITTLLIVFIIFAGFVFSVRLWNPLVSTTIPLLAGMTDLTSLGLALTDPNGYSLPFEVTSVLLLAALIGAIYIAYERKDEKK